LKLNGAAAGAAIDVPAGSTVTVALASAAGANFWSVSVISTDETNTVAAVAATLTVNPTTKTATFTAPAAAGSCVILQSTVGVRAPGVDANGQTQPGYTTTTQINVPTAGGGRVLAANEAAELDPTFGWISKVNALVRDVSVLKDSVQSLGMTLLEQSVNKEQTK